MSHVSPTIRPSTTTFAQLRSGGLAKLIDNLVTANPALSDPTTAPTVAATGGGASGGTLAAGTYIFLYTNCNGYGETLPATASDATVVGSTNIPRVTMPALPAGVGSRNLYVTTPGGAAGTARLYAAGITTTTYDVATNAWLDSARAVPTVNTTALSLLSEYLYAGNLAGGAGKFLERAARLLDVYNHGDPVTMENHVRRLQELAGVARAFSTAIDEAIVLTLANPGTVGAVSDAAGEKVTRRSF